MIPQRHFLKSSGWNGAGIALGQALNFGFIAYAARFLDAREFGIAAVSLLIIDLTRDVMLGGIPDCLVRDRHWRADVAQGCWVFQTLAAVGLACLTIGAGWSADALGYADIGSALMAISVIYVIEATGSVPLAKLRFKQNYRGVGIGQIVAGVLALVVGIVTLNAGAGFLAIVYARLGFAVGVTGTSLALARWRPSLTFDLTPLRSLRSASLHIVSAKLLSVLNAKVTDLIIGVVGGTALLGAYQLASRSLNLVLGAVLAPVQAVSLSLFSTQEDDRQLRSCVQTIVPPIAFVVFPIAGGLAAVSPEFVGIFFGDNWSALAGPVAVLMLACLPATINYLVYPVMVRTDRTELASGFMLSLTIIGAVFTVFLTGFGLLAVAVAFTARTLIGSVLAMRLLHRELEIGPSTILQSIWVPLAGVVAIAASVAVARSALPPMSDVAQLCALVTTGAAAYLVIVGFACFGRNGQSLKLMHDRRG